MSPEEGRGGGGPSVFDQCLGTVKCWWSSRPICRATDDDSRGLTLPNLFTDSKGSVSVIGNYANYHRGQYRGVGARSSHPITAALEWSMLLSSPKILDTTGWGHCLRGLTGRHLAGRKQYPAPEGAEPTSPASAGASTTPRRPCWDAKTLRLHNFENMASM